MSLSGHVTHIRDVAGEDHVGIGAGYDGINRYDFRSTLMKFVISLALVLLNSLRAKET